MGCGRGGEILGWLSFEPFRRRPAYHTTSEASVYVAENHRWKGIGKRIIAEVIRHGLGLGLKTLTAGASTSNGASLRLFEGSVSSTGRAFRRWRSSTVTSGIS